jgi:hypothetical protein
VSLLYQTLLLLSVLAAPVQHSFAKEVRDEDGEIVGDDDLYDDGSGDVHIGGGGAVGGGSAGGPSGPSGNVPNTPGTVAGGPIRIACLAESGEVRNAEPSQVCKAVLPKCSTLKTTLQERVKDMMSQKIWGYYNGKDVDLARSSPTNLVGTEMPYAICSVVGHKIKGSAPDAEIRQQSIGKKLSCGLRPRVVAEKSGKKFALHYDGENGKLWASYMLGAYPWLIRKHAADVLGKLQDDLGNVDALLTISKAMSQDLSKVNEQMRDYAKKLGSEAKSACDKPDSNLITECTSGSLSINDPAQRACTIVKAQLASNEGALPYMLAFEIMQRVQKEYDGTFAKLLTQEEATMRNLVEACGDTGCFGCTNRKKKISKTASCFFGGEFCTTDDGTVREGGSGVPGACKTMDTRIMISSGEVPSGMMAVFGGGRGPAAVTKNLGFAAVVERMIRHNICGQNSPNDDSVCDQIDIPSKPKNAP